jgi:hypothetical protein
MAINYTLNWSNDTLKPPFTLVGGTIDTTTTSLALTGKGSVNWGERVQENLIRLLENFASSSAPPHPTKGQNWYNPTTSRLSYYLDPTWSELATTSDITGLFYRGPTPPPPPSLPGRFWYDTANDLLKVYTNEGHWAYFALGLNSPTGAGAMYGNGGSAPLESYTPTFSQFTGSVNVLRTQTIASTYISSADLDLQIQGTGCFTFSTMASGTGLPAVLASYVTYLNDTLGQIKVKNNVVERWNDAGTMQIGTIGVGLANAKADPGTLIMLLDIADITILTDYRFKYSLSVSYNSTLFKYTFYQTFKVEPVGSGTYTVTVPSNDININGILQYTKSQGVGTMPTIAQTSFV